MKNFLFYRHYNKFPWEMGYPVYEEINNILPWMLKEYHKRLERDAEIEREYEKNKRGS